MTVSRWLLCETGEAIDDWLPLKSKQVSMRRKLRRSLGDLTLADLVLMSWIESLGECLEMSGVRGYLPWMATELTKATAAAANLETCILLLRGCTIDAGDGQTAADARTCGGDVNIPRRKINQKFVILTVQQRGGIEATRCSKKIESEC